MRPIHGGCLLLAGLLCGTYVWPLLLVPSHHRHDKMQYYMVYSVNLKKWERMSKFNPTLELEENNK